MANTSAGTVIRVDTTGAVPLGSDVRGILVIPNATATITIKADDNSGQLMWEYTGTGRIFEQVPIHNTGGLYVTVSASSVVYLYLATGRV